MPLQIIATEGTLSSDAQKQAFKELTHLLLELHGISGNGFMLPNVIGEVIEVPAGKSFSGGEPAEIIVFELKAPSFVLADAELQRAWFARGTSILERAAAGRVSRERIFGNVVHAVDGAWGIGGVAYNNTALGASIAAQAA